MVYFLDYRLTIFYYNHQNSRLLYIIKTPNPKGKIIELVILGDLVRRIIPSLVVEN